MNKSNYLIDLKIEGEELKYLNKIIKYLSTDKCTRNDINTFNMLIDKDMLKNEHYVIAYYITEFFSEVKEISKINLDAIKRLIAIDRDTLFKDNPNIETGEMLSVSQDEKGAYLEQMVVGTLEDIEEIELEEGEFNTSVEVLREVIQDLEVQNMLYASSIIYFEGKKLGREELKGRDGYIDFMTQSLTQLKNKSNDLGVMNQVTWDYLATTNSSSTPLFPHPIEGIQEAWGNVGKGNCISILAPQNVGKSTIALNYLASSIIEGVNSALFISEMSKDQVIARLISIIGGRKYEIVLPTNVVAKYIGIKGKKSKNEELNQEEKKFLEVNSQYINNIEHIAGILFNKHNSELGTLYVMEELTLKEMHLQFEIMKNDNVETLIVDHINGVRAGYPCSESERINTAYVLLNSLGKKQGIATIITNHIPEDQLDILSDPTKDKSNLRGSDGSQSTKTPDYVLLLDADMQMKSRGEFLVMTNKDRNTMTFFDPIRAGIYSEIGMIYEIINDEEEENEG